MAESIQKKLGRVRAPRVNITYDVEVGDATERKELPFVMGVLGNFSGMPTEPLPPLKEREFVEITPDNFDTVLAGMKPHVQFSVENKLTDEEGARLGVDLEFESMDDFSPDRVAQQVEPLRKLLELRQGLSDLRSKLQGNQKLEEILQSTLSDDEKRSQIQKELDAAQEEVPDA